jgi:F0F1-type ATP synthase membrane subunit b/b'
LQINFGITDREKGDGMEMEMKDELGMTVERLAAAAGMLEQAVERLAQRQSSFAEDAEASIGRIVATVEARREAELEQKLAVAEAEIATLRAATSASVPAEVTNGRKTLPVTMVNLLAKQGVSADSIEAGALDAALSSLSMEQRFAVKAQLMRAGLLG